jgi:hypothetical protein
MALEMEMAMVQLQAHPRQRPSLETDGARDRHQSQLV